MKWNGSGPEALKPFKISAAFLNPSVHRCFSLAAAMGVLLCNAAFGGTIAWDAPKNISSAADVSAEGAYYGSWSLGNANAPAGTVNGVTLNANASAQVNLVQVRDITPAESMTRHDRFKTLKYGIFSHYVWAVSWGIPDIYGVAPISADDQANKFNAAQYANDVAQAGAQYVVFTAWHANMCPLWPSPTMAKYGWGGRCPTSRDVISDMIDAVKAKGLRVYLYTHPYQPLTYDMTVHNDFINEMYAETIDRYGSRIDGLWMDENQIQSNQDSLVDYTRLMATIKSRNPDLVTMQNGWQHYTVDTGGNETVGAWNFGQPQAMYNLVTGQGITPQDMLR
ncbi:MAG: alpha-L-fucosidase, partial [bacterium]